VRIRSEVKGAQQIEAPSLGEELHAAFRTARMEVDLDVHGEANSGGSYKGASYGTCRHIWPAISTVKTSLTAVFPLASTARTR